MEWIPSLLITLALLPFAALIFGAGLYLISQILSDLLSQEAEELERPKRIDELKQFEQCLKKNCSDYTDLLPSDKEYSIPAISLNEAKELGD